MSPDDDDAYFLERAAQERRMAEQSADVNAQVAHRRLADLYAEKVKQPLRLVQGPQS